MTATFRVLDTLHLARVPMQASAIRHSLGLTHEQIYRSLVTLESAGLARVVVNTRDRHWIESRKWAATPGEPA